MCTLKHCFVINPNAGFGDSSDNLKNEIKTVFEKIDETYEIYLTQGNGKDKEYITKLCKSNETIRFYACGGDGTTHDLVNYIYGYGNVSFAVIPCGTGNDYIKSIGGYNNLWDLLENGKEIDADVIKANEHICMNIASIGLDATINSNTDKYKKKRFLQHFAYYLGLIESIFGKLGTKVDLCIDGENAPMDILMLAIAKGHYYGKTFHAAPLSNVTDGKIDVCIVKNIPFFAMLKLIPIYQGGKHINNPKTGNDITYQKATSITIKSDVVIDVNLDGETIQADTVVMEVCPKAIKLFCLAKNI